MSTGFVEEDGKFIGYHGASEENIDSIISQSNFKLSQNLDDWLGFGVYFFIKGISEPIGNAKDWAIYKGCPKGLILYSTYAVLSVEVSGKKILNTNNLDHLQIFNKFREEIIRKHDMNWKKNRNFHEDNRIIWNIIADLMELEVIIHNLYVKNKYQRIKKISSNVPNVTVMCVKDSKNIDFNSIKKIKVGKVSL